MNLKQDPAMRQPRRRSELSAKVIVAEYKSLGHAIGEFKQRSYERSHRRDGQTRYDYFVKPSQRRRMRQGYSRNLARLKSGQ
jgi:hypothetical protein